MSTFPHFSFPIPEGAASNHCLYYQYHLRLTWTLVFTTPAFTAYLAIWIFLGWSDDPLNFTIVWLTINIRHAAVPATASGTFEMTHKLRHTVGATHIWFPAWAGSDFASLFPTLPVQMVGGLPENRLSQAHSSHTLKFFFWLGLYILGVQKETVLPAYLLFIRQFRKFWMKISIPSNLSVWAKHVHAPYRSGWHVRLAWQAVTNDSSRFKTTKLQVLSSGDGGDGLILLHATLLYTALSADFS